MLLNEIRGQNQAVRTLQRAIESGRLAHAYLFEGPSGVGKERAAVALAKAVLCQDKPGKGCDRCSSCQRIESGNHPDARRFRPRQEGNRNIQVETLRSEILPVAHFAPFEGKQAFLIFPEADVSFPEQHPEAANALLKTLEEPRPNVCFVLLAERADRLLVTIRSRCQSLHFGRLPRLVLEHVLESAGISETLHGPAIALADGRADRVLALCEGGLAKSLLDRALRIDAALTRGDTGRLIELSEELAKSDDLALTFDALATYYRDVAAVALGVARDKLYFDDASGQLAEQAQKLGPRKAAERVQKLGTLGDLLARNANTQVTLDRLLLDLR